MGLDKCFGLYGLSAVKQSLKGRPLALIDVYLLPVLNLNSLMCFLSSVGDHIVGSFTGSWSDRARQKTQIKPAHRQAHLAKLNSIYASVLLIKTNSNAYDLSMQQRQVAHYSK